MNMKELQRVDEALKPAALVRGIVAVVLFALIGVVLLGRVLSLVALGGMAAGALILWACGLAPKFSIKPMKEVENEQC